MSTKIYNGYRIELNEYFDLFDLFTVLRDEFNKVSQEIINKYAAILCTVEIDKLCLGIDVSKEYNSFVNKDNDASIKTFFWDIFNKSVYKAYNGEKRDPVFDLSIKCSVLKTDLDKNHLYFIFFYENSNYTKVIHKYFHHYPYWDNADPPKNISFEEWSKIGEIWSDALKHRNTPSLNGLSMDFNTIYSLPDPEWEKVVRLFSTKEKRVNELSKRLMAEILFSSKENENSIHTFGKIHSDISSGKYNDEIEKISKKLFEILPDFDENINLDLKIYETYYNKKFDLKKLIM